MLQLAGGTTAVGLAGCSGSDSHDDHSHDDGGHGDDSHGDHEHSEDIGEPVESADVSMVSMDDGDHFDPHVVRIERGGSVSWTNESGSHSATAYHSANGKPQLAPEEATAWDSGVISEQGAAFDHTFETEGVYHYFCTPHETGGMIGSVIVGHPDPDQQPALNDPPSEKSEAVREKLATLNEKIRTALEDDS
ncbi:plastocyanin/azurin family copper-binding protein [Natrinema sp. SYSU A 869]|uniref:cupredoxin domain-containing protein n=1 Tax=Natrinema sp. SYSU A 869 TaxID=2871694 RepID=UPI001CA42607|nr:plastocyanin/azurin family copper-binding protein [Natrinema sp. SYSU A 869]